MGGHAVNILHPFSKCDQDCGSAAVNSFHVSAEEPKDQDGQLAVIKLLSERTWA